MTGFFDLFATGDDLDAQRDEQEWSAPPWFGPPEDELPACFPLGIVLGQSQRGVVALSHALVYSQGLAFELVARARGLGDREAQRLFQEQHLPPDREDPSPAFLRVGLELPDGTRVSNLGGWRHPHADEQPSGPVLRHAGGGGSSSGRGRVYMRPGFWLWPLPADGVIRVTCEWPVVEIATTTVEVDARTLGELRGRVVHLW